MSENTADGSSSGCKLAALTRIVCCATGSHSTAAHVLKPACSQPKSRPPAPVNRLIAVSRRTSVAERCDTGPALALAIACGTLCVQADVLFTGTHAPSWLGQKSVTGRPGLPSCYGGGTASTGGGRGDRKRPPPHV